MRNCSLLTKGESVLLELPFQRRSADAEDLARPPFVPRSRFHGPGNEDALGFLKGRDVPRLPQAVEPGALRGRSHLRGFEVGKTGKMLTEEDLSRRQHDRT